jgi:hypothetical protein
MARAAPTPAEILAQNAELVISCERCRALTAPPRLIERLVASGKGQTPVDQLRFRCSKHGTPGQPYVFGPEML